jgi:hypothetical protein
MGLISAAAEFSESLVSCKCCDKVEDLRKQKVGCTTAWIGEPHHCKYESCSTHPAHAWDEVFQVMQRFRNAVARHVISCKGTSIVIRASITSFLAIY